MKKVGFLLACAFLIGYAGVAQAITFTTYTKYGPKADNNSFLYWCPECTVENYEDETLIPGLGITEYGNPGTIADGVYENIVDAQSGSYQVFSMSGGMLGFGAWFDLYNPGGPGSGVQVYYLKNGVETLVMEIPNTSNGDFYGFLTDESFDAVVLREGTQSGVQETYYQVDMAVCRTVPEPGTLFLMGIGLFGAALARSRIKTA